MDAGWNRAEVSIRLIKFASQHGRGTLVLRFIGSRAALADGRPARSARSTAAGAEALHFEGKVSVPHFILASPGRNMKNEGPDVAFGLRSGMCM